MTHIAHCVWNMSQRLHLDNLYAFPGWLVIFTFWSKWYFIKNKFHVWCINSSGRVRHIGVRKWSHHWFRQWLVACMCQTISWIKAASKITVADMSINDYELLNIEACSSNMFWNTWRTQSLVVSCRYWGVPLISTKILDYSHVILLDIWEKITEISLKNAYTEN